MFNERQEHLPLLKVLLAFWGREGQVGHRDGDVFLFIKDVFVTQRSTGSSQHRAQPKHLQTETNGPIKLKGTKNNHP